MSSRALRDLSPEGIDALRMLSSLSEILNSSYELDEVLNRVLDVVIEVLGAQRGFLILEGPEVAAARGMVPETLHEEAFQYSLSVVEQVLQNGEAVLSHDAVEDKRFAASRSLQMLGTRSILCVPMRTRSHNIGLIYLDNQITSGVFTETDLELLRVIADLAAAAIERAKYFSQMVQNEKMAALGTLVAGIAHELNNPLTSIMGLAQLLGDNKSVEDTDRQEMAGVIRRESVRCRNLVRDLLGLTRREKSPRQKANLAEVAECAARLVAADFRQQNIDLVVTADASVPAVELNPEQWTQVVLNLLTNARYAVKSAARPEVSLRVFAADHGLRLVVADNGCGIPPKDLRKIFDPFFTTKPAGEGTGLGLSVTHSIVHEHGGTIQAANDACGGAVFTVALPYA